MRLIWAGSTLLMLSMCAAGGEPAAEGPKKEESAKKDPKDMTLDECEAAGICPVTRKPSKLIYHVKVGEKEYHFATRDAAKEFQADPVKFGVKKEDKNKAEKPAAGKEEKAGKSDKAPKEDGMMGGDN